MAADRKMRKVRAWTAMTLLLSLVFLQDLPASESSGDSYLYGGQKQVASMGETVAGDRASGDRDEQISRLLGRIDYLEGQVEELQRQVIMMNKELGLNRTLGNLVKEARSLASDAWDIAVEARTIATKAEQKADKALRDKK